jgi:hypothetical protein
VAQVLLPKNGGGRVAAHEILISTSAVRAMIRDGKIHTLPNAIQTGARFGMQSLEQALTRLAGAGTVDPKLVASVLASEATAEEPEPEAPAPRRAAMSDPMQQRKPFAPAAGAAAPTAGASDPARRPGSPYRYQ